MRGAAIFILALLANVCAIGFAFPPLALNKPRAVYLIASGLLNSLLLAVSLN